jgi:lactoylglutathione lyase
MTVETKISANVKQAVPFFGVSNMEESLRYYIDGLGFMMVHKWIDEGKLRWCWLQLGEAALMLEEFRREGRVGVCVSICFMCQDALEIYRELTAHHIPVQRPFVGNGLWVTNTSDPDGYRLSFKSPTTEPEDTVFAG